MLVHAFTFAGDLRSSSIINLSSCRLASPDSLVILFLGQGSRWSRETGGGLCFSSSSIWKKRSNLIGLTGQPQFPTSLATLVRTNQIPKLTCRITLMVERTFKLSARLAWRKFGQGSFELGGRPSLVKQDPEAIAPGALDFSLSLSTSLEGVMLFTNLQFFKDTAGRPCLHLVSLSWYDFRKKKVNTVAWQTRNFGQLRCVASISQKNGKTFCGHHRAFHTPQ